MDVLITNANIRRTLIAGGRTRITNGQKLVVERVGFEKMKRVERLGLNEPRTRVEIREREISNRRDGWWMAPIGPYKKRLISSTAEVETSPPTLVRFIVSSEDYRFRFCFRFANYRQIFALGGRFVCDSVWPFRNVRLSNISIRSSEKFLSFDKEIMDARYFSFHIILYFFIYVWSILLYQDKDHNVW